MTADKKEVLLEACELIAAKITAIDAALSEVFNTLSFVRMSITSEPEIISVTKDLPILEHAAVLAAEAGGIPAARLYEPSRPDNIVVYRHLAMWLARQAGVTYGAIALHFAQDRGTVYHARRQTENRIEAYPKFAALARAALAKMSDTKLKSDA